MFSNGVQDWDVPPVLSDCHYWRAKNQLQTRIFIYELYFNAQTSLKHSTPHIPILVRYLSTWVEIVTNRVEITLSVTVFFLILRFSIDILKNFLGIAIAQNFYDVT